MPINDKFMHFLAFFLLTLTFYWILEGPRKRVVNLTIIVCLLIMGVGSEFVQGLLPYRAFDAFDILANLIGGGLALLLNQWYHKRMLERKRHARGRYTAVADTDAGAEPGDLESGTVEFEGEELRDLETEPSASANGASSAAASNSK
ncbi:hypothetical protein BJ508DRAFT_309698 [Ascobolus immersus RN42]|uniref:VanZ-like domain-containing protein n=1 Tax=Ascobolus immersus RN42 TaxID=1160509 RepID=A0A3N4HWD5_ASCIM|nr:hypothetical protein BJ508DRAFT_309698 [Ascobolus immersus RN42]